MVGYVIEKNYLEKKVKSFSGLCDPDYHIDLEKDWANMAPFSPISLP